MINMYTTGRKMDFKTVLPFLILFQVCLIVLIQKMIEENNIYQADVLKSIYLSLLESHKANISPKIEVLDALDELIELNDIKNHIYILSSLNSNQKKNGKHRRNRLKELLDVCPEDYVFVNDKERLFVIRNCTNVRPISEVLSVVLNFNDYLMCNKNLRNVLSGLNQFYPSISVYIPSFQSSCVNIDGFSNIKVVPMKIKGKLLKPGRIWNELIAAVTTPYVLIGRDLNYFDNFSQVERQIRMLSYFSDIKIAGGSQRNATGHWKIGCYQINLRNYILEYVEGYHASRNSCIFCDHLLGSFISTRDFMMQNPFRKGLSVAQMFEDFFLQIKHSGHKIVNCPDAMYFSTNPVERLQIENRRTWLPLVRKLELNRIFLPGNVKHVYSCADSKSHCRESMSVYTQSYLLPLCCIEEFAKLAHFIHHFCIENNISYLLNSGTLLGAVKMNMMLPWDLDGDISFYESNFTFLMNSSKIFKKNGFAISEVKAPKDKGKPSFHLMSPNMYIEMYGKTRTSRDLYMPEIFKGIPTKQRFHRLWMMTQTSPGLHARNLYGWEIFKHSNHWIQTGNKNSKQLYKSGKFNKCNSIHHHACQDHFSADGNLEFFMP